MKWLALSLVFFVHTFLPARDSKPTLRALIACDMTSQDITRGSRADLVRMKKSCIAIAKQLGITSRVTTLGGKKFSVKKVTKWLSSIPSHSKDIIFFYYSGHGGRISSLPDPWPIMIFPLRKNPRKAKAIVGGSVYQYLLKKNPRLSIIIFDSCNNVFQRKKVASLSPAMIPTLTQYPALPGLKMLFLKTRGIITSCAAQPGESAVTTVQGRVVGGIFTSGLLYSMKYYAAQPNANWQEIFSGASLYCLKSYHGRQHPVYTIQTTAK